MHVDNSLGSVACTQAGAVACFGINKPTFPKLCGLHARYRCGLLWHTQGSWRLVLRHQFQHLKTKAAETSHCNAVCIICIISAGPMHVLRLRRCRATPSCVVVSRYVHVFLFFRVFSWGFHIDFLVYVWKQGGVRGWILDLGMDFMDLGLDLMDLTHVGMD